MKYECAHIKKGDQVMVLCGKEGGKTGKILRVIPKKASVLVEGLNIVKRHHKGGGKHRQSGIVEKESPIRWSNVMLMCKACNKPVRIKHKLMEEKKRRVCIKCGEMIDVQ